MCSPAFTDTKWDEKTGEEDCVYLCGNSLGLKPLKADEYVSQQMDKWGKT